MPLPTLGRFGLREPYAEGAGEFEEFERGVLFLDSHGPPKKPKTSSQKVRARDRWRCMVPGCSHRAEHAHHIRFPSQGGALTDPANQTGICPFHHTCIHDGYMTLTGSAPDGLVWLRRGEPWTGRPRPGAAA